MTIRLQRNAFLWRGDDELLFFYYENMELVNSEFSLDLDAVFMQIWPQTTFIQYIQRKQEKDPLQFILEQG